jgi:hypothetical protein
MIETYKILNNIDKVQYEQILPLGVTARNYIKRTVQQMSGTMASGKELWMSGLEYQRK